MWNVVAERCAKRDLLGPRELAELVKIIRHRLPHIAEPQQKAIRPTYTVCTQIRPILRF